MQSRDLAELVIRRGSLPRTVLCLSANQSPTSRWTGKRGPAPSMCHAIPRDTLGMVHRLILNFLPVVIPYRRLSIWHHCPGIVRRPSFAGLHKMEWRFFLFIILLHSPIHSFIFSFHSLDISAVGHRSEITIMIKNTGSSRSH